METDKRKAGTGSNRWLLEFIGIALLYFSLLQLIYYQWLVESKLFYLYLRQCADFATALLNLTGEELMVLSRTIQNDSGDFLQVAQGCDALRIFSVLIAVILAFPAGPRKKTLGLIGSVFLLYWLNILRIAALMWFEIHMEDWFDFMHHTLLPFFLWASAMGCFYYWGTWVLDTEKQANTSTAGPD